MTRAQKQFLILLAVTSILSVAAPFASLQGGVIAAVHRSAYALSLLLSVLTIAGAVGDRLRRLFLPPPVAGAGILHYALGIGVLGTGLFLLGLAGLFRPVPIHATFYLAAGLGWKSLYSGLQWLTLPRRTMDAWLQATSWEKAAQLVAFVMLLAGILLALVPPWGYDSLMYHLNAPRMYLEQGQITALPELWQANGPMLLQMLYGAGLLMGSEVFARLLHLSCGVMLSFATFSLGKRLGGKGCGWLATALLLGMQALPLWSSFAYADVAWALFTLLAVDALIHWEESRNTGWAIAAGMMTAFALASKYLAVGLLGGMALAISLHLVESRDGSVLKTGMWVGLVTAVLASPWYIRNWVVLGNPFFPFFFGGGGWSPSRAEQLLGYMHSFGRTISGENGFALWDVFFHPETYRTIGLERMNPLLLSAALAVVPSQRKGKRTLVVIILVGLLAWWFGTRQIRFLLPIIPLISILGALAVRDVLEGVKAKKHAWNAALLAACLVAASTAFINLGVVMELRLLNVIAGLESRDAFLERVVYDYQAMNAGLAQLGSEERMLMLWDGQGYYCGSSCIPDADQAAWLNLRRQYGSHEELVEALLDDDITVLLVGKGDAAWMQAHDPVGAQQHAWQDFMDLFVPVYTTMIFEDEATLVLRLIEPDSMSSITYSSNLFP